MQTRRIPMRMCIGCGEMKPKKDLCRVVRGSDGTISLDLTSKKPGRGAYLCPDSACLAKARKTRRLERAFSCQIPAALYDTLEKELTQA